MRCHAVIRVRGAQWAPFLPGGRQILPGDFCPAGRS